MRWEHFDMLAPSAMLFRYGLIGLPTKKAWRGDSRFWYHKDNTSPLYQAAACYWDRNIPIIDGRKVIMRARSYPLQGIYGHHGGLKTTWVPLPKEVRACCQSIHYGGSKYMDWSLYNHCKRISHIANRYDVAFGDLRKRISADLEGFQVQKPKPLKSLSCKSSKCELEPLVGDIYCAHHRWLEDATKAMEICYNA